MLYPFLFVVLSIAILLVIILIIKDKSATSVDSVFYRNYPIIYRLLKWIRRMSPYVHRYVLGRSANTPFTDREMSYIHMSADNQRFSKSLGQDGDVADFVFLHSMYTENPHATTTPTPVVFGDPQGDCKWVYHHRIMSSALGYSSLSPAAFNALAKGCKLAGISVNTGEAGLPRVLDELQCDTVFQIGVAGYRCRDLNGQLSPDLIAMTTSPSFIKAIEIKISQGASPGFSGGVAPAHRIGIEHAIARGVMPFKTHETPRKIPELTSPKALSDMISIIKKASKKPVGIKLCVGSVRELDELILYWGQQEKRERIPDFVTVDGFEGGAMEAEDVHLHHLGMPLKWSLPLVHKSLSLNGLRERIKIIASGKLATPERVLWAFAHGADVVAIGRGMMMSMGCIQAMVCNTLKCPSGVTNRDLKLGRQMDESHKEIKVASYVNTLYKDAAAIAKACGSSHPEMIDKGKILEIK